MNNLIIDVSHINKSFNGKLAVNDFSLQVAPGEICGFLGPNGSGKTTTLRIICGLLIPDAGEGHCLGYDILTESYKIKNQVGYMTQSFSLYHDLTAYENLDFIARIYNIPHRKRAIADCMRTFNLTERQNQITSSLSGGWKQRLALAGCLLHQPKLLLLDEPTAGVDPKARREFWDEIHKLSARDITTLVSTHYMDEAERCTKLAYISYGHLLATGTVDQIIQNSGLHTWSISGENLMQLEELLRNKPGVEQIAFFGSRLHVSGSNDVLLTQTIQSITMPSLKCIKINPGLEDVFISLVGKKNRD